MKKSCYFHGHLEYIPILGPFDNFVAIWYIFPRVGILNKEKSGNPGCDDLLTTKANMHKKKLSNKNFNSYKIKITAFLSTTT
jgi:hypothetical protein